MIAAAGQQFCASGAHEGSIINDHYGCRVCSLLRCPDPPQPDELQRAFSAQHRSLLSAANSGFTSHYTPSRSKAEPSSPTLNQTPCPLVGEATPRNQKPKHQAPNPEQRALKTKKPKVRMASEDVKATFFLVD